MAGTIGASCPKHISSWLSPPPSAAPIRYPRQIPKAVVPSFIGGNGLVLNLLMHEGAGGVVKDYSPYKNHGKLYNGVSWVDGSFGWALSFDGVDDYVEIPNSASLNISGEFTLMAWVRLNAYPTGVDPQYCAEIINKGANGTTYNNNYILRVDRYGRLNGWVGNPPTDTNVFGTTALSLNTWQHAAFVYVPSTRMTLYANGAFDSERTSGVPASAYTNNGPLEIGRWVINLNEFPGFISEVRIYNRALSADEIKRHYESTKPIFT